MNISLDLGVWAAALLTLCIYSFLYKDNPLYKVAEHIYIGVSTGYLLVIMIREVLVRDVYQPLFVNVDKDWLVLFPTILGLLIFTRFTKKWAWLSRYAIVFIVGVASGLAIPNNVQTYLLKQTQATMVPLWGAGSAGMYINNLLILVGTLTCLLYFFFSIRHEGPMKPLARTGVIYLMLFFGGAFGYTVMGRVSALIGRMRFLLIDWIGLSG